MASTMMDVDAPTEDTVNNVVDNFIGSISVSLHPLVIMNISEHWTRVKAQSSGEAKQVIGALIGKQKGRDLEIMNSFELVFTSVDDLLVIDKEYYNTKEEQFKQVFSDLEFLGWYTTGGQPNESDLHVHKQICEINESPIFLKLNPTHASDLPITIFESVLEIIQGQSKMLFVKVPYTLATEDAERIGVDHVARMAGTDLSGKSVVSEHLSPQYNAIQMLHGQVKQVLKYIVAVEAGEIEKDHQILREAYSLIHRLPLMNTKQFDDEFLTQCNDVNLIVYLGVITKCSDTFNKFLLKYNPISEKKSAGRCRRGLVF